jgi:hypothetical protein
MRTPSMQWTYSAIKDSRFQCKNSPQPSTETTRHAHVDMYSHSISRIPYSVLAYIPPPNMPPPPPCFPCASPCIFSLTLTLTSKNLDTQRSRQTDSPLLRSASRYDVSMHLDVQDFTRLIGWCVNLVLVFKRRCITSSLTGCTCPKPCRFQLPPAQSFAPKRFGVFARRTLTCWLMIRTFPLSSCSWKVRN